MGSIEQIGQDVFAATQKATGLSGLGGTESRITLGTVSRISFDEGGGGNPDFDFGLLENF